MRKVVATLIGCLLILAIGFGVTTLLTYIACVSFDITWAFKKALGVWAIQLIVVLTGWAIFGKGKKR